MTTLHSSLLSKAGFNHGFGTRQATSRDYPEHIHILRQVHGERIVILSERRRTEDAGRGENRNLVIRKPPAQPFRFDEGDAMITDIPGVSIGIRTADCLPILVCDTVSGTAAAIHCGWRSLALGLAGKVIRTLIDLMGSDPSRYVAAMGPSIGSCCYEVGGDVRRSFEYSGQKTVDFFKVGRGRVSMDLGQTAKTQLAGTGILHENMERITGCTMCDRDLFWSYRAGDETDRMISWITAK